MENYQKLELIQRGKRRQVFKAQRLDQLGTRNFVAFKEFNRTDDVLGDISPVALKALIGEATILRQLSHPNIINLIEVIIQSSIICLVLPYYSMDLHMYMRIFHKDKMMEPFTVKTFLYQITCGMQYCHMRHIIHCDMKPHNLLIDLFGNLDTAIKIADFGLATLIESEPLVYHGKLVTLCYRPPELMLGATTFSYEIDIWSIGCIFAEMMTTKRLFQGNEEIVQLFKIFEVLRTPTEEIWPGVTQLPYFQGRFPQWTVLTLESKMMGLMDENGLTLLRAMLNYVPNQRITATDILKHPYFNDLDRSKVPVQPEN